MNFLPHSPFLFSPEELVDSVVSEAASERGVLHLLGAEHGERGVAEASDVHGRLQVELRRALGPHPAPLLLLELVAERGERLEVVVPAGALAVEDVRQEGDHAQGLGLALILEDLLGSDLGGRKEGIRKTN